MDKGCRRCPKDDFYVETMDENHPITKGIDNKWMNVFDDLFTQLIIHPEADVHVLASVYDDVENYRIPGFPPAHHPVEIPGGKLENMLESMNILLLSGQIHTEKGVYSSHQSVMGGSGSI